VSKARDRRDPTVRERFEISRSVSAAVDPRWVSVLALGTVEVYRAFSSSFLWVRKDVDVVLM